MNMDGGTGWPLGTGRHLQPGQRTQVWIAGVDGGPAEIAYTDENLLLEAPNWTPDGRGLLLNGLGRLWRLDPGLSPQLSEVPLAGIPPINNDHVPDAERGLIYLSANDGHLYVAPIEGGAASRLTHDPTRYHFLHGVSPDGTTLAFVALDSGNPAAGNPAAGNPAAGNPAAGNPAAGNRAATGRLAIMPSSGGEATFLTDGSTHLDGPEYSPDGVWLYLNTEHFGNRPGHAQLARMPAGGGALERLVASDTVDWFPHPSPTGEFANYLSFPGGTLGHPADLEVEVRLVRTADWGRIVARFPLFGGQGTINVNNWSPDGRRFAFVAYPIR